MRFVLLLQLLLFDLSLTGGQNGSEPDLDADFERTEVVRPKKGRRTADRREGLESSDWRETTTTRKRARTKLPRIEFSSDGYY